MPLDLPSHSRFKLSNPVILPDGIETIDLMRWFDFLDLRNLKPNQMVQYVVNNDTAGRPDLISDFLYGTPQLYWVLIMVNKPKKVLGWPRTGTIVYGPSKSIVMPAL